MSKYVINRIPDQHDVKVFLRAHEILVRKNSKIGIDCSTFPLNEVQLFLNVYFEINHSFFFFF